MDQFIIFILIFVRMTGLFLISPVFGRRNVPTYMKIGFCLVLSYVIFSSRFMSVEGELGSWFQLAYCILKELLVGFAIGFVTTLTFSAIWIAAQIVDIQIGFGIINAIDPQSSIQVPLMGNFQNMLALLLFFTVNGHHKLIQIIFNSYDVVPLGIATITNSLSMGMIRLFADSFLLSVKIAIPIVAASLLSEVAFGILSRAVPQMNIFIIGIPFKILIGLVGFLIFIPFYIGALNGIFEQMFNDIGNVIRELIPQ